MAFGFSSLFVHIVSETYGGGGGGSGSGVLVRVDLITDFDFCVDEARYGRIGHDGNGVFLGDFADAGGDFVDAFCDANRGCPRFSCPCEGDGVMGR